MALDGLSLKRRDVSQTIDLEDWIGHSLNGRVDLILYTGQLIVDRIIQRTQRENLDVNGKSFAPYSASYKKSDAFEAYGKNNDVDMTLTENMLTALDFEVQGNNLKLYFNDPEEADKAYGHITGMKGHKFLDGKVPKREFFGITKAEFEEKILPEIKADLVEQSEMTPLFQDESDESFLSLLQEWFT